MRSHRKAKKPKHHRRPVMDVEDTPQSRELKLKKTQQRREANGGKLVVTEHAVMRYAERVHGFDAGKVKNHIYRQIAGAVEALGDGKYPLASGMMAVVKDGAVVTVVES